MISRTNLKISHVAAFDDNYIWFIHGLPEKSAEKQIIIVDPGDAEPVINSIRHHNYLPQAIFITHHHHDHTGGIKELVDAYQIPVYGPANERIPHITYPLMEKQTISLTSMGLLFDVLDVPGHTIGHIAYLGHQSLFIGDTLFAGGCGRIFEGTAEQMHESLSKLLNLENDTMVYCAHEYTQDNLKFAQRVEPDNKQLIQRIEQTTQLRLSNQPTVPSTLELEKQTNPFLRFNIDSVKTAAENFAQKSLKTPAEVFRTVRYWKDTRNYSA
ncbi:MAG: hydroxyacylglutathione hydrolase [gamma proteobacterium symbiont of Bathyaustriella thionipta]|nr:hydroxyacylglutathione hydrolase [gamma proteobacterium symbiont of Bathyaustriella thionipta]MCU7950246.1 hydroxyacylglutathione hydrolase [gamma proteobacterium symbiont of Bathyaustriella thionipta]MCU7952024.1 hydroxyacylglutathione hydrolase [gamma proteobacterium symbiont of Bathyaustriella thionipta]MCU7957589.1 hydroxyacylglutathione hydrolase [gamma proteobacterium symbiont of Bathyaustriella thionipta]MCU7965763.1 hydroxyacylglutathione hydrolase [gamma proteobacterium symbiont of 